MYFKNVHLPLHHIIYKINLRWNIGLNIKVRIIKILEENIGEYFCDLGVTKYLFGHKKH